MSSRKFSLDLTLKGKKKRAPQSSRSTLDPINNPDLEMAAVPEADQVDTVQLCPAFCSFCFL